jgi:hypothetical protein
MSFPIDVELNATDHASGPMNAVIAVMRKGSQATADQITQFKAARSQTSLQVRAMNELTSEYRAATPMLSMFGRAMSSVGAIGGTLMSMTNTMILSNINLGISQNNVSNAQQQLTMATQAYYAALQEYGPTDARTIQAKQQMINAENNLRNATAQNRLVQIQTTMAYAGMALSVGSLISQIIAARAAWLAFGTAEGVASVESDALDVSLDADPILAVVAAVSLLVLGLYKVTNGFTNWNPLVKAGSELMTAFHVALKDVWGFISTYFAPELRLLIDVAQYLWQDVFMPFGRWLSGSLQPVLQAISGFFQDIDSVLMSLVNNPLFKGLQNIAGGLTGLFQAATGTGSWASSAGIPKAASGGIFTSPTIAMIGEAGPEAVVPLTGGGGAGGGNYTIIIQAQGSIMTQYDLLQLLDQGMQRRYNLRRRTS